MNYQKLYDTIVERAKSRELQGYKERHHVIPKCMNGSDDPTNIVELTAKEHFLCHKLLVFIHPNSISLWHAYNMMSVNGVGQRRNVRLTAREYQEIREALLPSMRKRALKMVEKRDMSNWSEMQRANRLKDGITPPYKGIPVQQIDREGNIVKVWKSTQHAKDETGIRTITNVLRGDYKYAGGYNWKQIK